jgi:hypothetical protein
MSLLAKVFIVIQTILVMTYLGMTASLYQHRRDWRTSYMKLKGRYSTAVSRAQKEIDALRNFVRAKNELVSAKEREVRSLKSRLDTAISTAQRNANRLRAESIRADKESQRADNLLASNNKVVETNTKLEKRKRELEDALKIAGRRMNVAEGQVARLTNLTTSLEQDISNLRSVYAKDRKKLREKELLIAMAESQGVNFANLLPGPPVPSIDGTVVAVKGDLKPALVLLSVGSDDRVEQGFQFSIYRKDKFIGKVVVERVLRDSAGCRVVFTAEGQEIQAGDSAATRLQ